MCFGGPSRECPKEAMEAVATLIFATARFSNLPELADLRTSFTERYGSSTESCINKEFIEKTQKKAFPMDKKLQLMEDIAQEFSVDWNTNMFENKIPVQIAPTYVQQTKERLDIKEDDDQFHFKEVASGNNELGTRMHEPSSKTPMQKKQLRHDELPLSYIQKQRAMIIEIGDVDASYPDQKARVNTKYDHNQNCSDDTIFEDRASIKHGEFSHSNTSEDVKDVMHDNGQDRWQSRPVNAANCRTFNLRSPYVKSKVKRPPPDNDYVNPRDYEKSSVGRDNDQHKDGRVHLLQWDYENLAAEISALTNS